MTNYTLPEFWIDFKYGLLWPYYKISEILYKIKKVCKFSHLLWNNYEWDWSYIFPLLKLKLEYMEKAIRNGCHMHRHKDADKIKIAINLCSRIIECDYSDELLQQDIDYLFKYLAKHIQCWWD